MSRVLTLNGRDVYEDEICVQADMSDKVTVTDVMNHLALIVAAPNGTGDRYAAQGAINLIHELAAYAGLALDDLAIDVRRTA